MTPKKQDPVSKAIQALENCDPVGTPPPFPETAQLALLLKDHLLARGEYPENFQNDIVRVLFGGLRVAQVEAQVRAHVLADLQKLAAITNPTA